MTQWTLGQGGEVDVVGQMVHQAAMRTASETGHSPFEVVLETVRERVTTLLTPAQLENPGPAEREVLRQAVADEIARYNEAAPVYGRAPLEAPVDVVTEGVLNEILGLGPLEGLLAADDVEDIYIQGPHEVVVVTADGQRRPAGLDFGDRERLMNLARRALAQDGKRVDFAHPFADARLQDGSRFHISIYPCAEPWPQIVIRRHRRLFAAGEDRLARLIGLGTLTPQAALLLRMAIQARVPMLVTGATAAGKTTIINGLAGELDPLDAVVCIEDTRELEFPGKNVSYLVTRSASPEGEGAVAQRYLVQQSLRKRPDWIVLGEARGAEAWDFAQAGNTGHAVLGSVHANSARDAIDRYRDLCLEAGQNLRENVVLRGVVRAFRLVVYVELDGRLRRRVVKHIAEVTGNVTEQNVPVIQDLFSWQDGPSASPWSSGPVLVAPGPLAQGQRAQDKCPRTEGSGQGPSTDLGQAPSGGLGLCCTGARPYPTLAKTLERAGCSYEQVIRGEGIPAAWNQEAQRWAC
jgi:pilus assembly protein CpaF